MTRHFFENDFVKLHYYKYGSGSKPMLCFHGFGMHGKQFKTLEPVLGTRYTFYGFDLFFHKETKLKDQSLLTVKKGLSKEALAALIMAFCRHENINRFSVIGYSMGTHYATTVVEELGERIDEYIVAAPSSINPGRLIRFFGKNRIGKKLLEKLVLSERALTNILKLFKRLRLIDEMSRDILYKEIGTAELRFSLYACFTYLRFLETDESKLIRAITENNIRSIFIFGKRDRMYPTAIGKGFLAQLEKSEVIVLDENHEMINQNFVNTLAGLLL